jgi:hypothetical protein
VPSVGGAERAVMSPVVSGAAFGRRRSDTPISRGMPATSRESSDSTGNVESTTISRCMGCVLSHATAPASADAGASVASRSDAYFRIAARRLALQQGTTRRVEWQRPGVEDDHSRHRRRVRSCSLSVSPEWLRQRGDRRAADDQAHDQQRDVAESGASRWQQARHTKAQRRNGRCAPSTTEQVHSMGSASVRRPSRPMDSASALSVSRHGTPGDVSDAVRWSPVSLTSRFRTR